MLPLALDDEAAFFPRDARDELGKRMKSPRERCAAGAFVALFCACQDPTQITLELTTDAVCADVETTSIAAGKPAEVETDEPAAVTRQCEPDGHIGSLVLVPSGDDDATIGIRVVTGVLKSAKACVRDGYRALAGEPGGCIVARRQLRYVPHTPLKLPIKMNRDCLNVPCGATQTCEGARCVSAEIEDARECAGAEGCELGGRGRSGRDGGGEEAGAPEAGIDAALDAGVDTMLDAKMPDVGIDTIADAGMSDAGMSDAGMSLDDAGAGETGRLVGMTAAHNAVRARDHNPMPSPPLPPMKWSPEIAAIAQSYADTCPDAVSMRPGFGENFALFGGLMADPTTVVESWAGEESCYTFGPLDQGDMCNVSCTAQMSANGCGNYTQIVWRDSTELGCGVGTCPGGQEIWVCYYRPPGNFVGMLPY